MIAGEGSRPPATGVPAPTGAGAPTVLVLDDERDVQDLVRLVLERSGYRVLTTADGTEALRLLREQTVAVALVDLLMPGMSGRRFLLEVGRLEPAQRPVVLIVSALREEAARLELAGVDGYTLLLKPFVMTELREQVARAAAAWRAARGDEAPDASPES